MNNTVTARIELNTGVLKALDQAQRESLEQAADAALTELRDRQVMPFDTGNMQNDSTALDTTKISQNKVSIVTTAPQARRLYFHPEYNFRRNNNSKAGGKWFESFLNDDFIKKAYAELLKRNGGL